jgi:uncharacterized protein (DUF433 family)
MTFSFSIIALIVLLTLPVVVLLWATESKKHRARRMRDYGCTFQQIADAIKMSKTTARNYCKVCAA